MVLYPGNSNVGAPTQTTGAAATGIDCRIKPSPSVPVLEFHVKLGVSPSAMTQYPFQLAWIVWDDVGIPIPYHYNDCIQLIYLQGSLQSTSNP